MCEVRVIVQDDEGTVVETLDDVATIVPGDDSLTLVDLFGRRRAVKADFKEIQLLDHTVVLTSSERSATAPSNGAKTTAGEEGGDA
jgi:predicted RNA-binding protein